MTESFRFTAGDTPLLVSLPHGATAIPDRIAARMTESALRTPDTDWHVGGYATWSARDRLSWHEKGPRRFRRGPFPIGLSGYAWFRTAS